MSDTGFWKFLTAFTGSWFTKTSGPLTVPFTVLAVLVSQAWLKLLLALLALVCAVAASYAVWRKERLAFLAERDNALAEREKLAAEQAANQKPRLVGGISSVVVAENLEVSLIHIEVWVRNERPMATGGRIIDISIKDRQGKPLFLRQPPGVAPNFELPAKLERERLEYGKRVAGFVRRIATAPSDQVDPQSACVTLADDFDQPLILSQREATAGLK